MLSFGLGPFSSRPNSLVLVFALRVEDCSLGISLDLGDCGLGLDFLTNMSP